VVWNLLSNAVKFTEQGGRVGVRLERIDPHICITVSDTGRGIRPDILPYVFDRFRQADASSARRYGGLGLGLALVKYLVELHGGTIRAASAGEGQGATFDVVLPVRAVATPIEEAEGASTTVKSSGELAGVRALVVDDEDDARELIKMALTQYGADVIAVSSASLSRSRSSSLSRSVRSRMTSMKPVRFPASSRAAVVITEAQNRSPLLRIIQRSSPAEPLSAAISSSSSAGLKSETPAGITS
jgi:hypothetical protein